MRPKCSDLNQRQYCEFHGLPQKAFDNWRQKSRREPDLPTAPRGSMGTDHLLNYRRDGNWGSTVLDLTKEPDADNVVEVSSATLAQSIRIGGHIALIGVLTDNDVTMQWVDFDTVVAAHRLHSRNQGRAGTRKSIKVSEPPLAIRWRSTATCSRSSGRPCATPSVSFGHAKRPSKTTPEGHLSWERLPYAHPRLPGLQSKYERSVGC